MNPFSVYMDWNGNGTFGDANEDVTEYLQGPFRWNYGKDQLRSFAPAMTGEFAAVLDNRSGLFSTWNTGSALSGLLEPGKRIRIEMKTGSGGVMLFVDGTDFNFLDGTTFESLGSTGGVVGTYILDDLRHNPDRSALTVDVPGLGVLSQLRGKKISTRVYQNITTSDALHIILDTVGWPSAERDIQTGLTVLAYWWMDNEDAFEMAERLKLTEGPDATLTSNKLGYIVFENRDSRILQTRSTTAQASFTDDDWHTVGLNPSQNYKDKIQVCKLVVDELVPGPLSQIWQLGSDLVLGPSEARRFEVRGVGAFINLQIPTASRSNTIWKFVGSQVLTSGAFKIEYLGQQTVAISWNASGSTVAAALEGLSTIGTGNAIGTGSSLSNGVFVELIGAFAGVDVTDLPTIIDSTLNPVPVPGDINVSEIQAGDGNQFYEKQRFTPTGELISGQWSASITYSGSTHTTSLLNYNASATQIGAAFAALPGLGGATPATANHGPVNTTPVDVNYVPIVENIENAIINNVNLMRGMPSATVNVTQSQQGGVADYAVPSGTVASIQMGEASGTSTPLIVTADVGGAVVTGLRVRGQALVVAQTHQVTHPTGAVDVNARVYQPNIWPYISLPDAETYAESFYVRYSVLRPSGYVVIETPLNDFDGLATIFQYRVSDMITVVNTHLGLNHNATIEQIDYATGDGEELHLLTRLGWELAA